MPSTVGYEDIPVTSLKKDAVKSKTCSYYETETIVYSYSLRALSNAKIQKHGIFKGRQNGRNFESPKRGVSSQTVWFSGFRKPLGTWAICYRLLSSSPTSSAGLDRP